MPKRSSLLSRIDIAAPCPASWNEMAGNDEVRFCKQCKLNVYNISAMSASDAEKLIIENEGKLCARIYRRKDGTIITENCPVGLRWLRNKIRYAAAFVACVISWFLSGSRGQAQEIHVLLKKLSPEQFTESTLVAGAIGGWIPVLPVDINKQLPPISPWLDNGCSVSEGNPPRLVLHQRDCVETERKLPVLMFPDKRLKHILVLNKLNSINRSLGRVSCDGTLGAAGESAHQECDIAGGIYVVRKTKR